MATYIEIDVKFEVEYGSAHQDLEDIQHLHQTPAPDDDPNSDTSKGRKSTVRPIAAWGSKLFER